MNEGAKPTPESLKDKLQRPMNRRAMLLGGASLVGLGALRVATGSAKQYGYFTQASGTPQPDGQPKDLGQLIRDSLYGTNRDGSQSTSQQNVQGTPEPRREMQTNATPVERTATAESKDQDTTREITYAERRGDKWQLTDPDGRNAERSLPEGFTPDSQLKVATDLQASQINADLKVYENWENALNTGRAAGDRLAGYNYDYNDFCFTEDFFCNAQGDMQAWRVFQGQELEIPGIGRLEGSDRRSVVALFINLEEDTIAWDKDELGQVMVKRGFTATGRVFDGNKLQATEENLAGHWLSRQAHGTPEKSYIGVTDHPDNAQETLFVTVLYRQWGQNSDGTERRQFQLYRADLVNFNK